MPIAETDGPEEDPQRRQLLHGITRATAAAQQLADLLVVGARDLLGQHGDVVERAARRRDS